MTENTAYVKMVQCTIRFKNCIFDHKIELLKLLYKWQYTDIIAFSIVKSGRKIYLLILPKNLTFS